MSTRRKAVIYTAVIFLMLLSIWAFGILGPIFVSLVLEGIAWWLKKREKKKEMLTKCLTLCEKEQIRDMNENKIKMFFDSKNS